MNIRALMNIRVRLIVVIIVVVALCILFYSAFTYVRQQDRARALQQARDSINECDDIQFISADWPPGIIDDDGLNMKPLAEKRKILQDILNASTTEEGNDESNGICKIVVSRSGKPVLNMFMQSDSIVVRSYWFRIQGIDMIKVLSCQPSTSSEVMEKATEILHTCDNIRFSTGKAKQDFVDEDGLNGEPIEKRRDAVLELFSQYKPQENRGGTSFMGTVFLENDDKTILKIALYQSGFMIRGYYFEVLNPERNATMLRLLNFKKLKESQSP